MTELYGFNETDVVRISSAVRAVEGSPRAVSSPRGGRAYVPQTLWVPFRNDATETAPAYGVLRITGMATVDDSTVYTVGKPNTTFLRLYLVNGSEEVEANGYGFATLLGFPARVLYESGTPAYGESWGPANGQWSLKKWRYGFTVMGGNDTTALTTYAVQRPIDHVWGQTDGAINKGSTGTVEVYDGNDAQITSTNLTSVKNKFANVSDNKKVSVEWLGGSWYLKAAEC